MWKRKVFAIQSDTLVKARCITHHNILLVEWPKCALLKSVTSLQKNTQHSKVRFCDLIIYQSANDPQNDSFVFYNVTVNCTLSITLRYFFCSTHYFNKQFMLLEKMCSNLATI